MLDTHHKITRARTIGAFLIVSFVFVQGFIIPSAQASLSLVGVPPSKSLPTKTASLGAFHLDAGVLSHLTIHESGDLYVLTDPEDPSFLEVIEKLPSGGFGRILRYRGWTEERGWIDLEFVYQDKENTLTILDYVSGKFFRTTFTGKREDPFSFFPLTNEKSLLGDLIAYQPSSSKWAFSHSESQQWTLNEIHWLHNQVQGLSEEDLWSRRHTRGPPQEGPAL